MSDRVIPLGQNAPWFRFKITLSGVRYTLEARFNLRMDRWILSIMDAAGAPILMGIPLLIQRPLTQYPTLALPPGDMFAVDRSGKDLQPTISSFVTDHELVYGE